jgi:predicted nucleotidyltransferase
MTCEGLKRTAADTNGWFPALYGVPMTLLEDLHRRRDQLLAIAARHGASNVRLFGSVLHDEDRPDSDVDLLIDMAEGRGVDDYLALVEELGGSCLAGSMS